MNGTTSGASKYKSRRRTGVFVDRDEQRVDHYAEPVVPQLRRNLQALRDDAAHHQARADSTGFQQNAETGKLVHGLLGWDKLTPESMALYQNARNQFRLAGKPAAEARMWMIAGMAGGIQPWWHHVGAYHEDRRMYHTAEPVFRWHKENVRYLMTGAQSQPLAWFGRRRIPTTTGAMRPPNWSTRRIADGLKR
jgi:hypothetical protein